MRGPAGGDAGSAGEAPSTAPAAWWPVDGGRPAMLAGLLAHAPPGAVTEAGVTEARRRLAAAVAGSPVVPRLRVDRRRLRAAGRAGSPAAGAGAGRFRPTPTRARRAVGLDAVARCLRGSDHNAADAVAAVLADVDRRAVTGQPLPWWGGWWATSTPGVRAVIRAEAVTWATRLWTGVEWGAVPGRVVVTSRDEGWVCPPARWLSLHGRVDVRVGDDGTGGGSYLVVAGGTAGPSPWWPELALPVLVGALNRGPALRCGRVVGWWPDSGQVRTVDVDDTVVVTAAARVAAVAARWWRTAAPARTGVG